MESITSVYSDTRSEYTKQLCIYLVPAYFRFFVDLLTRAKQTTDSKKVLWQFQTYLNEIHDWNMEKVHNEINSIQTNAGCDYLEDLLTAVFIAHTKVLTAIRLSANNKKVEITIPKVDHFLFKVLCEISKLLWSSTYLFREDISGVDRQQNYKLIEGIISEGIMQAIRSLVPVKSILKNLVNHDDTKEDVKEDTKDNNSDDEDEDTVKVNKVVQSPIVPSTSSVSPSVSDTDDILETESVILESSHEIPMIEPLVPAIDALTESADALTEKKDKQPTIINLDEKPKVSFASFNSLFSDNPDSTNMIGANENTPDLEIADEPGLELSGDDFDSLDGPSDEPLPVDDYEEL
jgi:hypothetical protein